jgi:hypothetical protein
LFAKSSSSDEILNSLNLKFEHRALEVINRLEAAIFAWKVKVTEHVSGKSPVRTSWSFVKDSMSEMGKMELLLDRAESLLHQLKIRYPNLPHTFLNVTKIQYGKVSYHVFMSILPIFSKQPSSFPFFFGFHCCSLRYFGFHHIILISLLSYVRIGCRYNGTHIYTDFHQSYLVHTLAVVDIYFYLQKRGKRTKREVVAFVFIYFFNFLYPCLP